MHMTESPRSKEKMIRFLKGHFRYYTGNSWNRSRSYARNIKVHRLGLDHETEQRCYEMLDVRESFYEVHEILDDFAARHQYEWQICQNGRSGGYFVLYQGGRKATDHKTRCDQCFLPTWYEKEQTCHSAGCGGTLRFLKEPLMEVFTYPGRGVDDEDDYESWSYEDLRRRVMLVKDFDETCNLAVQAFVAFAKAHKIEEQQIMVPQKVKVAVEA